MRQRLKTKLTSSLTLVACLMLLSSCFGGSSSVPDDHYYRLPDVIGTKLDHPILNGSLSIKKVITYGIYSERTLIYTDKKSNLKLNRYHYHHWEKSPSILIQDNLVQYLRSVAIATQVMAYRQQSKSQYSLESELISMHREISNDGYIAAIVIDFRVINKTNNSILINKRYSSNITSSSDRLIDTIKAYGGSLKEIYTQLIFDLQKL